MNFTNRHSRKNFQLLARNEGKLKSYESCTDIRAWSHDMRTRDRYLREWMKRDMPLCIVPVSTLVGFFKTMTCRRNCRAAARCHPDCKSKVILESITTSCNAMKECLRSDENLEKFFVEEELETSHWPCERCLEALKSIKLFWRIILEKVFAINLTKNECFDETTCCAADSVRDMARNWKRDMVHQAMFVKNITPQLQCSSSRNTFRKPCVKLSSCHIPTPCSEGDTRNLTRKASRITINSKKCSPNCPHKKALLESSTCRNNFQNECLRPKSCPSSSSFARKKCSTNCPNIKRDPICLASCPSQTRHRLKDCNTSNCSLPRKCSCLFLNKCKPRECLSKFPQESLFYEPFASIFSTATKTHVCTSACKLVRRCKSPPKKMGRCTSVRVRTLDACCGTNCESPEVRQMRENMLCLQRDSCAQKQEIEKLKKENCSLKCELQNLYRKCKWDVYCTKTSTCLNKDATALIPKPFECSIAGTSSTNLAKDAESELIITMKNCKHESFRHVHLLQVLHKTNDPCLQDLNMGGPCYKDEDPIRLLNKVQTTLGAMVKREMTLARKRKCGSEIEASFQRVDGSKSAPSSAFSSRCTLCTNRSNKSEQYCMKI